jgi:hypothetical protein
VEGNLVIFHSVNDWAFNWSALQHLGMGYRGMKYNSGKVKYNKISQEDCSEAISQAVYRMLDKNAFTSRSNHSMYTQSAYVFERISTYLTPIVENDYQKNP